MDKKELKEKFEKLHELYFAQDLKTPSGTIEPLLQASKYQKPETKNIDLKCIIGFAKILKADSIRLENMQGNIIDKPAHDEILKISNEILNSKLNIYYENNNKLSDFNIAAAKATEICVENNIEPEYYKEIAEDQNKKLNSLNLEDSDSPKRLEVDLYFVPKWDDYFKKVKENIPNTVSDKEKEELLSCIDLILNRDLEAICGHKRVENVRDNSESDNGTEKKDDSRPAQPVPLSMNDLSTAGLSSGCNAIALCGTCKAEEDNTSDL